MTVNWFDSPDIYFSSSSASEVFCRQSGMQWWCFWQFECSCTIMLKVWPGCFDVHFSICKVSNSCHLLVLGVRFLLCSTWVLAALPHRQNVVDFHHSEQFAFLNPFLQFQVMFGVHGIHSWIIACQYFAIGSSKLPHYGIFPKCPTSGSRLSPADSVSPIGIAGCCSDTMLYDRHYVACHIEVISALWVHFLFLTPPISDIQ